MATLAVTVTGEDAAFRQVAVPLVLSLALLMVTFVASDTDQSGNRATAVMAHLPGTTWDAKNWAELAGLAAAWSAVAVAGLMAIPVGTQRFPDPPQLMNDAYSNIAVESCNLMAGTPSSTRNHAAGRGSLFSGWRKAHSSYEPTIARRETRFSNRNVGVAHLSSWHSDKERSNAEEAARFVVTHLSQRTRKTGTPRGLCIPRWLNRRSLGFARDDTVGAGEFWVRGSGLQFRFSRRTWMEK